MAEFVDVGKGILILVLPSIISEEAKLNPTDFGVFVVVETANVIVRKLLDTKLADLLDQTGGVHFENAARALRLADNEASDKGKAAHRLAAATHGQSAYGFWVHELTELEKKQVLVPEKKICAAHYKASEAAIFLAKIFRDLQSTPKASLEFKELSKQHFEAYASLLQKLVNDEYNGACDVASAMPQVGLRAGAKAGGILGAVIGGVGGFAGSEWAKYQAEKTRDSRSNQLAQRKEEFLKAYQAIVV
jgi:hypothetical protein